MNWIVFSLLSAFTAALINHIDKYLLEKHFRSGGIGALVIFSALIGVPASVAIGLIRPEVVNLSLSTAIVIAMSGATYVLAVIPYLHALEKDEASVVAPLLMTTPIISYTLGYIFLGERLSFHQIIAFSLILVGSLGLITEVSKKKRLKIKKSVYILSLLTATALATNSILFKYFAVSESFWTTSFWEYIGFSVTAIFIMAVVKTYRKQFLRTLNRNKLSAITINTINEIIALTSKILLNYASFIVTVVALSYLIVESAQPLFVIVIGIILTLFFPSISQENISFKHVTKKFASVGAMILGTILLTS